jgi:Protein of unknown function (DUF3810)
MLGRPSFWRAVIVAVAAIAALAQVPASIVERLYTRHIYAGFQPLVTSISNLVPFPLFDLLAAVVLVGYVSLGFRDLFRMRGWWRGLWAVVARAVVWSAAIYLLFLAMWGLNYRRVRLADALRFDESLVTPAAAGDAARIAIDHLNALYDRAHVEGWPDASAVDPALSDALDRAVAEIGRPHAVVPGRPKRSLLDWWFRRAGVDGMTDPFLLETLVVGDLLPFERPFVVAHEWSHLAGVGDEGEANFLGWLACMRATPSAQYSGWLFLYPELARSLPPRDRAALAATLRPGPRADLQAMRERAARNVSPRMSAVGWRVYDSYLKANRVEAGVASYTEVTRLVLGARLVSGRAPLSE